MKKKKLYQTTIPKATVAKTYTLERGTVKAYYTAVYAPTVIAWSAMAALGAAVCFFSLPAGLAVVGVSAVFVAYYAASWRRYRAAALAKEDAYGEFAVDFNEYGMVFGRVGEQNKRIPWLMIPRIVVTKRAYALLLAKNSPLLFPRELFTEEERYWLEREVMPVIKKKKKILADNARKR